MIKKRERLEIIRDVLRAIQNKGSKVKPTHILYKSNLSHKLLSEYLGALIEKKLVIEEENKNGSKAYSLTDKGFNYIKDFSVIKNFIESYGLE